MKNLQSDAPSGAELHLAKPAGAYAEQSASVLAGILESVDDLFAAVDANLRFVAFNAAFRHECTEVYGRAPALGQTLPEELAGYPEQQQLTELARRALDGESFSIVQEIAERNNLQKVYQVNVTPVPNAEGKAVVVALVARDITEKREAERKFRQLLEASPDALLIARDGIIEYVNKQAETLFGYAPQALVGKPLEVLVPVHLRERHLRERSAYEHSPKTRPMGSGMSLSGVRADGTEFPVEVSLNPLTVDGRTMVVAAIRDISVRRKVEEELRREVAGLKESVTELSAQLSARRERDQSEARFAEQYRSVFEQGAVGIAVTTPNGRFLQVNPWLCAMTAYSREELLQLNMQDITHPDELEADLMLDATLLKGVRSSYAVEKRFFRKDGRMIWAAISVAVKRDAGGAPRHFVVVMADVTHRRELEQKLTDAHFRLRMATEIGRLGFWERDVLTEEMYFSPEWKAQAGYLDSEMPSTLQEWSSRLHPDERDRVMTEIQRFIDRPQGEHQIEYRFRHRDGNYRWFLSRMIALLDPSGKLRKVIGIRFDITDRKDAERALREEGQHDMLTGLPNRKLLYEYADHVLAAARRSGVHGAIVFVDLDHFKEINDTYGHEAGDAVLKEVARRLLSAIRKGDIAGRLGGDEFLVILPQVTDAIRAASIAEHMLARLNRPHRIGDLELEITPSIGVALFPDDSDDMDTLIRKADHAMYVAKGQGRSRVQLFTPELARRADDVLALESRLKAALRNNEFELYFQPIVSAETDRVIGAEALLRWHAQPDRIVPPGEFLPVAESSGLIGELGTWVLRSACNQQLHWLRNGISLLRVGINISPVQLRQKGFVTELARVIRECGIDPAIVQLELAENTIMQDLDKAIEVIRAARDAGVLVAVDNFGTGDCGLGALGRLPVNTLKIDVSLVRSLRQDARSKAMAQAAIAMGRSLNLETVADGIESKPALDYMRRHQCVLVQGFHLGRPMSGGEFQTWYRQHVH